MSVGKIVATRSSRVPSAKVEHRGDGRAVGLLVEPLEDRRELLVDLRPGRVRDRPLRGIVLEVDRALGEPVEPTAERVSVEVPEAEHAAEPEHRDGLEVLAHQLRLASADKTVEKPGDERLDQFGCRRLDDARTERRVEHPAQTLLRLAVDEEDALPAHRPLERRGDDTGGEHPGRSRPPPPPPTA